ncbi:MAG: oligopeptide/dipeptide ABC transporter ATP-binding protein, partial [Sciscionella sp.]
WDLFARPQHPYTRGLLGAVPRPDLAAAQETARLTEIPGLVPTLRTPPSACVFEPRCPRADAICQTAMPPLAEVLTGQRAACYHPGSQDAQVQA